jgi:D-galacturonate reductase
MSSVKPILLIGGGMIVRDQILPSLLHLQRIGRISDIEICTTRQTDLSGPGFRTVFGHPLLYRERIAALPKQSIVFVAAPDPLHFEMVMAAIEAGHHVICVKPLALRRAHAEEIARAARERGVFVGIEYHKRFDTRSLMARRHYREGRFGEFRLGSACLLEKWYYRNSNFQNWFTCENSDAFTYIGCHYVDLVAFITGLLPTAVSVHGIRDRFPNGNEGCLWTDARVLWNNGACLNVQNALGFPDSAPGTNTQSLTMYCSGGENGALIAHSDQFRGLKYNFTDGQYSEPSPDYFQYVEWTGPGLKPVGYGYQSIEALVEACHGAPDENNLIATPANSSYNEAVIEAARESLHRGGQLIPVLISGSGPQTPGEAVPGN